MEEISLSIEETNKLRASIGLAPIPVPKPEPLPAKSKSLTIEETNKLRASLGLRPIPVESEPTNPTSLVESESKRNVAEEVTQPVSKKQKLLWEDDTPVDDWLEKLSNKPEETQITETKDAYNDVNVQIAHSHKQLQDVGEGATFTLKDTDILQDEEDEMDNEVLRRDAKLRKELKEKEKNDPVNYRSRISVQEESSDEENVMLVNSTIVMPKRDETPKETPKELGSGQKVTLFDEESDTNANDYAESKPKKIKMKKLKKKSGKSRNTDSEDRIAPVKVELEFEEDENDEMLQRILDAKRRKRQNERAHLTPEQLARELKNNENWKAANEIESRVHVGMVYDDTSDFLDGLKRDQDDIEQEPKSEETIKEEPIKKEDLGIESLEKEQNHGTSIKKESASIETASVKKEEPTLTTEPVSEPVSEPAPHRSLGETLRYIKSQNLVITTSSEQLRKQREAAKQAELFKIQLSIEERIVRQELEATKNFMNLPKSERESQIQAVVDQRMLTKNLALPQDLNYTPQVRLKYTDDSGNELNTKQAFKHLSHKFHGNK